MSAGAPGRLISPLEIFRGGFPVDGDIDVDWFCDIQNKSTAVARFDFLRTPANVHELLERGYGGDALERMWKAVYRACIGHGHPLPESNQHHAESLGVIFPE